MTKKCVAVAVHIPKEGSDLGECAVLFSCDQFGLPGDKEIIESLRFDFSDGDSLKKFYLNSEDHVNVLSLPFIGEKDHFTERTWPEERPFCRCGGGECTGCLTRQVVEDFNRLRAKGEVPCCGMHDSRCSACFVCNLIDRLVRRAKGEKISPPN